jgi:membrane-associated phospholipid phosphatase
VVADLLPRVDLSRYGELFALAFIIVFLTVFVRHRRSDLPYLFTLVGVFYAGRGTFLLLLPIGAPAAGPFAAARAGPWPDPSHSFFPSGHFGLMCLLSLSLEQPWARRTLACGALVYAVGTLLTRAHYTADLLGGLVLAYGVHAWGERHLRASQALRSS